MKQIPLVKTGDVTIQGNFIVNPFVENSGSFEASQNVKISTEDKKWLIDISEAISQATGNPKYGASSVGREAIAFYRKFYGIRNKLIRYEKSVVAMLENLP